MSDSLKPIQGLVVTPETPEFKFEFEFIIVNLKMKGDRLETLDISPGSELEQKFIAFLESSIKSGLI